MSDDKQFEEENQTDSPSEKTHEPDEWQKLDGRSRERFKKLVALKNEAIERAKRAEERLELVKTQQPVAPTQSTQPSLSSVPTQDELLAAKRLRELGFLTKEEMQKQQDERDSIAAREKLNQEHKTLRGKYENLYGDNAPIYDEQAIEDAMYRTGIYDPEYHYEKMNKEELRQLDLDKIGKKSSKNEPTPIQTRSRISSGEPWTPEYLSEKLKGKEGHVFYMKNKEKIDTLYREWGGK